MSAELFAKLEGYPSLLSQLNLPEMCFFLSNVIGSSSQLHFFPILIEVFFL